MAVRVYGVQTISKKLLAIKDALRDKELLERIGRTAVAHIQVRTREGLDKDGKAFKPLAPISIGKRASLEKYNKTSAYYDAAKSNLHFTGQLLRALKFMTNSTSVFIEVTGIRKAYKTGPKQKAKEGPDNKDLVKWLREQGREFMGADDSMRKKVREVVVRHVTRVIRRMKR